MSAPGSLADRLAERTAWLCGLASVTGSEATLCTALAGWAEDHGLPALRQGNCLIVHGARPLALCCHLDTVPVFPGEGPGRREGDRLYGKGASDMKGGLAVALELMIGLPPALRPHLVCYDREEGPYAENGLEPLFPALPPIELAVCLEPTDNTLQLGCVGSLHATVRFRGQPAHSARPWEGVNAVHRAGPLLAALDRQARVAVQAGGLTFYEVTQVTRAEGGRARNVLPDLFRAQPEPPLRPRGHSPRRAQQAVERLVRAQAPEAELTFTDLSPSGPTCEGNPHLGRLRDLGLTVTAKQAWTDVARFGVHGIDAVNFGPGQTSQAHQRDEWCDVPSLAQAHRTLDRWLRG